ncbi:MAG TPA: nicotinate phosphoribosyltransferase, partial [Candidatus Binatia bacterium]|nr:nicotinate phosphoribosyltransferase [Candidatus Binatia bacterium]
MTGGALLTDLYQLTMLHAYFRARMDETAVFEFFVRMLPPARRFLVAAGLEQVIEYLEGLTFTREELEWIGRDGRFSSAFVDWLAGIRFTGDVDAMPEGTVCFADEPILRVTAPLPVAQLVESRIVNLLHFQILVASKAARAVLAAPGKLLVDFGMRRAHGAEAAVLAARAGWLAGLGGTATALAALRFGIPVYSTMAHSFVLAHDDELTAFEGFARADPMHVVLLLDTYDTEAAAEKVAALARRGIRVHGVRLDSGDLAVHARRVRAIFDRAGLAHVTIFASGNLDEYAVADLVAAGAPIDGFGLGTRLDTSADVPYLDCAYKLEEYAGRPRRKRSEGKANWPGRKQVYRRLAADGRLGEDIVTLAETRGETGEPLLAPALRAGRR